MTPINPGFSQQHLREHIHYDPATGTFTWIKHRHAACVGKEAGYLNSEGYRIIGFEYRKLKAHRLAWFYEHGRWPEIDVDHANGVPSDNRLENLREATKSQNLANQCIHSDNASGRKGVCWSKRQKRWRAQIKRHGMVYHLGYFTDIEAASTAYVRAANAMFGEFARAR